MKHVMIDLETMDNTPTSAIVAIGAVKFNRKEQGETFYTAVDLESSMAHGLSVSAGTIQWWLKQSEQARAVFMSRLRAPLENALADFASWIDPEVFVWGNGSDFDNVILRNAYDAIGYPLPWKYFNNRCFRTLKNELGMGIAVPKASVKHNALDDAVYQAQWLQAIWARNERAEAAA